MAVAGHNTPMGHKISRWWPGVHRCLALILWLVLFLLSGKVAPAYAEDDQAIAPGALDFYSYLQDQIQTAQAQGAIGADWTDQINLDVLENLAVSLPADDPLILYWLYLNYAWADQDKRLALQRLYGTHPALAKLAELYPNFLTSITGKLPALPHKPHHLHLWQTALTRLAAWAAVSAWLQNDRRPYINLAAFRENFGTRTADLLMHWWWPGLQEVFGSLDEIFQKNLPANFALKMLPEDLSPAQELYFPVLRDEGQFTSLVAGLWQYLWGHAGLVWDNYLPTFLPAHYYYGAFTLAFSPQQTITPIYLEPFKDPLLEAIVDFGRQVAMGLAEKGYASSLPQIKILLAAWPAVQQKRSSFTQYPLVRLQTQYRQGLLIALNLPLAAYYQQQERLPQELRKAQAATLRRIFKSCRIWLQGPRWD